MDSTENKDLEAVPLIDVSNPVDKNNEAVEEKSEESITEQLAKKVCCTFRVRVIAVILLLLFQLPIFAYYYRSSYSIDFHVPAQINRLFENISVKATVDDKVELNPSGFLTTSTKFVVGSAGDTIPKVNLDSSSTLTEKESPKIKVENDRKVSNEKTTTTATTTTAATSKTTINDDKVSNRKTTTTTTTTTTAATSKATIMGTGEELPVCPSEPPNLVGHLSISFDQPPNTFEKTLSENPLVTVGGHGKPEECMARHKLAIIIPYRDRMEHLRYFVEYMHPILLRQQVDYQIFIINQFGSGKFNRAKLMNVGFLEALKIYPFNCFSFHDVDLILEDDRSLYWCSDRPRHMSAGVDKFNYVLPYSSIFGGVTLLSKEQMETINGFSNKYWGWGGEDDDVYNRLKIKKYKIVRYPMDIARYKMIRHKREKGNPPNPDRFKMIRETQKTYLTDGINSIEYKVIKTEFHPTYTNITVDLFGPP